MHFESKRFLKEVNLKVNPFHEKWATGQEKRGKQRQWENSQGWEHQYTQRCMGNDDSLTNNI